ncbi:MAG: hypothetical protein NTX22_12630 [Ignavibacteriales bacterium]|nr:hypothetical protein [Ignavibacteriales bacterium]
MAKSNCWEIKNCGRQPGGVKVKDYRECPASTEVRLNGINSGQNGGRCCWPISGTFCGGKIQGTFAVKYGNCLECNFYKTVFCEEGKQLVSVKDILAKLKNCEY